MRKILLATTALVAFAGAAQAAEAPVSVNVGGYVDFRAGQFHEDNNNNNAAIDRRDHDFETEFRLNIAAEGKAANGIEYGGLVSLWNGAMFNDLNDNTGVAAPFSGGGTKVREDQAYVWMSGAFGKAILGDDHGASDLFVYAPTIGEGQIDGTYTNFTDPTTLMRVQPAFIEETENSTKITYYTPKVGNANHKVQLGASFAPNFQDQGQNIVKYTQASASPGKGGVTVTSNGAPSYQDFVEATAQYTGNWNPVSTVLSATLTTAAREGKVDIGPGPGVQPAEDFTSWGLGAQATYANFTLGGSYVDAGRYNTTDGQNKTQDVWTVGLKYELDKIALGVSGISGRGYNNNFQVDGAGPDTNHANYVKDFKAIGFGAAYTWFPGLTMAADAVFFSQERDDVFTGGLVDMDDNDGHVIMLTQKITF